MNDLLVYTIHRQYPMYMFHILQECSIDINTSASGRISAKNVLKIK